MYFNNYNLRFLDVSLVGMNDEKKYSIKIQNLNKK